MIHSHNHSHEHTRGSRSECQDLQLITASISICSTHKIIAWFQKIWNTGQESCAVAPTAVRLYALYHERSDWTEKCLRYKHFIFSHISVDWTSDGELNWTNGFLKWSESIRICSDSALNESSEVVSLSA